MRFRPRTTREFASILLLKRCGIPVVEPVGCGGNGRSSLLITREKTGFITVREQLRRFEAAGETPPEAFLAGWSAMTAALFRNRLYLYDFHCGNMLCRWPAGDFAIIDPQGVKRSFVDVEKRQLRMIRRQYGEFFGETTREVVQKMLAENDPIAIRIFKDIGIYLGYTLAFYSESKILLSIVNAAFFFAMFLAG